MKLYGSELIAHGILLIAIAVILGIVFAVVHFCLSSQLKKTLEKEYGSEKLGGENK